MTTHLTSWSSKMSFQRSGSKNKTTGNSSRSNSPLQQNQSPSRQGIIFLMSQRALYTLAIQINCSKSHWTNEQILDAIFIRLMKRVFMFVQQIEYEIVC